MPFFSFFFLVFNSLKRILTFFEFLQFLGKKSWIYRKKVFFAQLSRGFTLPTPLVVRPQKSTFLCVSSLSMKKYFSFLYFVKKNILILICCYICCSADQPDNKEEAENIGRGEKEACLAVVNHRLQEEVEEVEVEEEEEEEEFNLNSPKIYFSNLKFN